MHGVHNTGRLIEPQVPLTAPNLMQWVCVGVGVAWVSGVGVAQYAWGCAYLPTFHNFTILASSFIGDMGGCSSLCLRITLEGLKQMERVPV